MQSIVDWIPVPYLKFEVSFNSVNNGVLNCPDEYKDVFGLKGWAEWEKFKTKIRKGDKLFVFNSPLSSWNAFAGRMGIALVRNNTIIDGIAVVLN